MCRILKILPHRFLNAFFDYPGELGKDGKYKIIKMIKDFKSQNLDQLYTSSISLIDENETDFLNTFLIEKFLKA